MAAKGYLLSEADREALQALLDATKARGGDPAGRPATDWEEHQAPSTYVAIPATDGITALSRGADLTTGTGSLNSGLLDDQPGEGYCAIYRLVLGEPPDELPSLVPVEVEVLVYNLTDEVIPGHEWCLITRDRFGTWWVVPKAGGTTAGGGTTVISNCCDGCELEDTARPTANTTCDVYRAGNGPPNVPDVSGVSCYLSGVGCSGLTTPYYTHILTCAVGTDIRDDWQGGSMSLGPSTDHIFVPNKTSASKVEYKVLIVRRVGWAGTSADYLQVYLSRVPGVSMTWPTNNV